VNVRHSTISRTVVLAVGDLAANQNANNDGDHSENDKNDEETDPSFFASSPSGFHCFVREV
jgi:hypothetical protein